MSSKDESEIHKKSYLYLDCVSITYELLKELPPAAEFSTFWVARILDKEAACTLLNEI
jgi:hypothetical protein